MIMFLGAVIQTIIQKCRKINRCLLIENKLMIKKRHIFPVSWNKHKETGMLGEAGRMSYAQNEDFRDFIVKYSQNVHGMVEYVSDRNFQIINDDYAVLYVPKEQTPIEINSYSYYSIPHCYTYMDLESVNASGIGRLQNHPYLQLRGKGTLIAVIDSGVDYTNPLFIRNGKSRIIRIWDQEAVSPEMETQKDTWELPYGVEYTKEQIDQALQEEDPLKIVPATDRQGHGTMLAGIAAGNKTEEKGFSGVAFEASILVVKLKKAKQYLREFYLYPEGVDIYQENDIMLGITYAIRCARQLNMPLAVCIGLGCGLTSHLGDTPLSQYADNASRFAQNAFCIAAGNEGNARHHFQGKVGEGKEEQGVELRIGEETMGFAMEFWGETPAIYRLAVQSPSGETLPVSDLRNLGKQTLSFVFVQTKIEVSYIMIERLSGNTLAFFRFLDPAPGIWKILVRSESSYHSQYHFWLPVRTLISPDTYFLQPSPYKTITCPGNARDAMTLTAYNYRDESLYIEAGRGYTLDGTVKPDLAAPGVEVLAPLLNGEFGYMSGTSLSAAHAAGAAALLFEWAIIRENAPYFNGTSIKNYLVRGAKRRESLQYPNPDWGYGILDLYHTFELLT